MKDFELSVQEIKDLMDTFHRNKLGKMKLKAENFSLELEAPEATQVALAPASSVTQTVAVAAASATVETAEPQYQGNLVSAPIVGTFYAAPAPDKPPYVQVGSKVKKGDVLFIIESMKLMNEVTSEYDGTVTQILAENAQGVEYGQPILCIE